MKALSTIVLGIIFSVSVFADLSAETIESQMNDASVGKSVDVKKMAGGLVGTCYVTSRVHMFSSLTEYKETTKEALYVGNFTNAKGDNVDLAISTEQTHGAVTISKNLKPLLRGDADGLKFIKDFVKIGQSGVDNDYGKVDKGADYAFNYVSKKDGNTLVVTAERLNDCRNPRQLCSPPILQGCARGTLTNGHSYYEGCIRADDVTSFKQISDTVIISHRTASQYGEPLNNYSFVLPELSTYCAFEKQ